MEKADSKDSNRKNQFDVTDFLAILLRRKWLIIVPLILVTGVTIAGSYMITPEYESSAIIWVGNPVKLSRELQQLLGSATPGYQSERDRELELRSLQNEITSSPFISQLVQNLRLDQDPDLQNRAIRIRSANPDLSVDQIKFDILLNDLRDEINVDYAGKDQIELSAQSTDPILARDMTQALSEIFISEKMKQELGSVRISQDFSYEQLAKYEKDLRDRITEKTEFEREFMKIRLDEVVASDENRKEINSEIERTKIEIEEKKGEERQLLVGLSDVPKKEIDLKESSQLKRLKNDIDNHLGSIANLMLKYTWSAPEILNHKTRLFGLISEIENENKRMVNEQFDSYDSDTRSSLVKLFNARAELDIFYSRVNQLRLALDNLNEKVDLVPEYQARLDQLEREIVAARDLRDKFKEQQESSLISQALLRESKYKVIEPAKVPLSPFKPQRSKIAVLGILLGLAIGGAATLLTEVLDKSFRKVEDVEETMGFPVVGVIPPIESVKKLKVKK
jgi:succinoglycan biosynthesis transport protein ExoP